MDKVLKSNGLKKEANCRILQLHRNVGAFMTHYSQYAHWTVEYCTIAPIIPPPLRDTLATEGVIVQLLTDLWWPLLPTY